jgi:sugar/nucleoside kinase (ribokinase family)
LLELQYILGRPVQPEPAVEAETEAAASDLHRQLKEMATSLGKTSPAIIVRAGKYGSYTISDGWTGWTPAFWQERDQSKVVDPTGGGNAFLGGFAAGMILSGDDIRAGQRIDVVMLAS